MGCTIAWPAGYFWNKGRVQKPCLLMQFNMCTSPFLLSDAKFTPNISTFNVSTLLLLAQPVSLKECTRKFVQKKMPTSKISRSTLSSLFIGRTHRALAGIIDYYVCSMHYTEYKCLILVHFIQIVSPLLLYEGDDQSLVKWL